jgi:hypothetical protein
MIQNFEKLPSDLHEKLRNFTENWESFALKVLKKEAIHRAPRFILIYDLETTKEFEPKFHGFLSYDIEANELGKCGLVPARFEENVRNFVHENREWLEVYDEPKHWADVLQTMFQKPERFAIMAGLNLLHFDLQKSDLQIGRLASWMIEENRYTYVHDGKPIEYRRINASHSGRVFIFYNFDLLPLATQVGFKKGEKKTYQLADEINKHFFKTPNPPTFLKPSLSIEEINYCINDCLVELELFAHLSDAILRQTKIS